MKNKKIYLSPEVRGIHVLQVVECRIVPTREETLQQELKEKEEEGRFEELELAKDEAYKKGQGGCRTGD